MISRKLSSCRLPHHHYGRRHIFHTLPSSSTTTTTTHLRVISSPSLLMNTNHTNHSHNHISPLSLIIHRPFATNKNYKSFSLSKFTSKNKQEKNDGDIENGGGGSEEEEGDSIFNTVTHEERKSQFEGKAKTKLNISREEEDKMLKFLRFAQQGKSQELKKHGYTFDKKADGYYKTFVSEGLLKMDQEDDYFSNEEPLLDGNDDDFGGAERDAGGIGEDDDDMGSVIDDAFQLDEISTEPPLPSLEEVLSRAQLILKNALGKESDAEFEQLNSLEHARKWKREAMPNRMGDDMDDDLSEAQENLNRIDSPYFDEDSSSPSLFKSLEATRTASATGRSKKGKAVKKQATTEVEVDDATEQEQDMFMDRQDTFDEEEADDDEDFYDPNIRFVQFNVSDEAIDALKDFEYETRTSIDLDPMRDRLTVKDKNDLIDMCLYAFDDGAKQEEMLEKKFELSDMQRKMTLEKLPTLDAFNRLRKNKLFTEVSGLSYIDETGSDEVIQKAGDIKYTFAYDEQKGRVNRRVTVETETKVIPSLFEKGDASEMADAEVAKMNEDMMKAQEAELEKYESLVREVQSERIQNIVSSVDHQDIPRLVEYMHNLAEQLGYRGSLQEMKKKKPAQWTDFCQKLQEMVIDEDDDSDLVKGMILFGIDPDEFIREYMTEYARHNQTEEIHRDFADELSRGVPMQEFESYDSAFKQDPTYSKLVQESESDFSRLLSSMSELSAFMPLSERKKLGIGSDVSPEGILRAMIKMGIRDQRDSGAPTAEHQDNPEDLLDILAKMDQLKNGDMTEEEAQQMMKEFAERLPTK